VLSTDNQPGNLVSWDGFMQAASTNFLQTPFLIITGKSRHRLEILAVKDDQIVNPSTIEGFKINPAC